MPTQSTCPYCLTDGKKIEREKAELVEALTELSSATEASIKYGFGPVISKTDAHQSVLKARAVLAKIESEGK